jgi:hypothetical protein
MFTSMPQGIDMQGGNLKGQFTHEQLFGYASGGHKVSGQDGEQICRSRQLGPAVKN